MKAILAPAFLVLAILAATGCTAGPSSLPETLAVKPTPQPEADTRSELDDRIAHYAAHYDVPDELVHRVVKRESTYNPKAYNAGNWGLMQIRYPTARTMGYRGEPEGLFDAETNLKYAVKYLRGAWLVADGDHDRAVGLYQRGYYYDAKARGMLVDTGLRPAAEGDSTPSAVARAEEVPERETETAPPPASMAYSGTTPASGSPASRPLR